MARIFLGILCLGARKATDPPFSRVPDKSLIYPLWPKYQGGGKVMLFFPVPRGNLQSNIPSIRALSPGAEATIAPAVFASVSSKSSAAPYRVAFCE